MKKWVGIIVVLSMFALSGCSSASDVSQEIAKNNIATVEAVSIQWNESSSDYSIFLGLYDKSGRPTEADVDVDIRIVNEKDEEVYRGRKAVSRDDFSAFMSKAHGEEYLGEIRVPVSEVKAGKSSDGKVYLTVHNGDEISFDEVKCKAYRCLPLAEVKVKSEKLPVEIAVRDILDKKIVSKIRIDSFSYEYNETLSELEITVSGVKTYENGDNFGYDTVGYRIYDGEKYLKDSGDIMLSSLRKGDKFKEDSIDIFDVVPGETYTIEFVEDED